MIKKAVFALLIGCFLLAAGFAEEELYVTISIADFESHSDDGKSDWVGAFLKENVVEVLSSISGVRFYERSQITKILDEYQLQIQSEKLFDPDTMRGFGNLVAIDYLIVGSFFKIGENIKINIRVTEVATGRNVLPQQALKGKMDDLMDLLDELNELVARALQLNLAKMTLMKTGLKNVKGFELYNEALTATDTKERIEKLKEARARSPEYDRITLCLADTYFEVGSFGEAEELYRELLEKDPEDFHARYNLAVLYFDTGRYKEAAAEYLVCTEIDPADPYLFFNLGLCYEYGDRGDRLGPGSDLEKAAELYERSVALNPDMPKANYALGILSVVKAQNQNDLYLQLKFMEKAVYHLETYLRVFPTAADYEEVKMNLENFKLLVNQLREICGQGES
jgi:tetratricopeptide (TPR) repeat protein